MNMNDMVLISVDDHISEPPDMFKKHLSATPRNRACTAHFRGRHELLGIPGMKMPSVGLNAVVGRVPGNMAWSRPRSSNCARASMTQGPRGTT